VGSPGCAEPSDPMDPGRGARWTAPALARSCSTTAYTPPTFRSGRSRVMCACVPRDDPWR